MAVSYEIHPTIGFARIGNSTGFFIGPEPDQPAPPGYRDAGGILRQAARFRLFRVERNATGAVASASEVNETIADIEWTVHLANRKAVGPRLNPPGTRRNDATGDDAKDAALIVDPGPRSVSGRQTAATFDNGAFRGTAVPLGDIRYEAGTGRLLVLGGKGKSGFVLPLGPKDTPQNTPTDFADNDGWYDDASEGPVTAKITLKGTGETPPVTGARVVVAPPDYAPAITNFLTLYDVYYQIGLDKGLFRRPEKLSFMRFVYPILERASGYAWVNAAGYQGHGDHAARNFDRVMVTYSDPHKPAGLRHNVFLHLREPKSSKNPPRAMPRLYSEDGYPEGQYKALTLTAIQYEAMQKWGTVPHAPADFEWDSPKDPWATQNLPDALDRVAMEACTGGPYFPGIEVPRFVLDLANWESNAPLRLREDLPAGIVNAGSALPWQADYLDCTWEGRRDSAGLETGDDGYGWWPAQRPDSAYIDPTLKHRETWIGDIATASALVDRWHTRRFVLAKKNNAGQTVYVFE